MKADKKPTMRHCTGCGAEVPKKDLIRVVRSPEGEVSVDTTGKSPGRGAYICRSAACLQKACRTGRLGRSLGVAIPDDVAEKLKERITAENG